MRKFVTGPLARFERRGESPTLPTTVTKLYTVLLRGEGDVDLTPPWVHRGGGRLPAGVVRTICGRRARLWTERWRAGRRILRGIPAQRNCCVPADVRPNHPASAAALAAALADVPERPGGLDRRRIRRLHAHEPVQL